MSLFRRRDAVTYHDLIPSRMGGGGVDVKPSTSQAMRSSVLWAGLHLRASLVGMMPVDVFRKLPDGTRVLDDTPAVLMHPDEYAEGKPTRIGQWLYASEMALGGWGNSLGIVHSITGNKTPARVELVPDSDVSMRIKGTKVVEYKFGGEVVKPQFVWHERRHLLPGVPVGMSAVLHGAMAVNGGLAANRFMGNWFVNQAIPAAWFRNSEKVVNQGDSRAIKAQFAESLKAGDMLVTGKDWEYTALQAKGVESGFLDAINASSRDLCRFVGVPGDMVDVPVDGSSITYANITQRNLQLLTINMGPDVKDHEDALTPLAAAPRYVKLNRSVVLAMDDKTRAEIFRMRIDSRTLTPDQARALDDQAPLAPADYEQFDRLFGSKNLQPTKGVTPA